ncbi:indolethylamine N-methyltransferase-like [Dendropsophus ebraccatus]|uniref:indolethylamine N-methyltransferase-like n=1 Tax=Dendropsophus ebraccatus TaxID=150705 RepID=UPI00383224ED
MASSTYKRYHIHGMNPREHLEHYFADKSETVFKEDVLNFPIENLAKTFRAGYINGDVLIDLSAGSFVHHLYAACEFFKHIIVLKVSDRCILELKKWLDSRTGAFNWGHATQLHAAIEGCSGQCQNKVRSAIQHLVQCNLEKENMTDPIVLPPADCIISAFLPDVICKDKDDYIRNLRKFSEMLKPGGHLILLGGLDMTYLTVGKDKFHALTYDEEFVRKALVGEGFVIDDCKVKRRTYASDLIDHKGVIFITAHKK